LPAAAARRDATGNCYFEPIPPQSPQGQPQQGDPPSANPLTSSFHESIDIFDLQQETVDHTMQRATDAGLTNIVPRQGDAQKLPYADKTFDGVYLVTVLGEIPDRAAALAEGE
jgi:hypothetical protein